MYSIEDLLRLLHSEGADALRLRAGAPPVIVLDGEPQAVEGPAITAENAAGFIRDLSTTRQRRELRDQGVVRFVYRFRSATDFVVCARVESDGIAIEIH
jgi:Tfp pilus assembly pilus retraction ATPase PilT